LRVAWRRQVNAVLKARAEALTVEDLGRQFEETIVDWRASLAADEWFFADLRKRLIGRLSPSEAFESMGGVVAAVLRQSDGLLCAEAAQLLLDLARRSDTTEVHPALDREWGQLMRHLQAGGSDTAASGRELSAWYRRAAPNSGLLPTRPAGAEF
jgi:hypothetical protein